MTRIVIPAAAAMLLEHICQGGSPDDEGSVTLIGQLTASAMKNPATSRILDYYRLNACDVTYIIEMGIANALDGKTSKPYITANFDGGPKPLLTGVWAAFSPRSLQAIGSRLRETEADYVISRRNERPDLSADAIASTARLFALGDAITEECIRLDQGVSDDFLAYTIESASHDSNSFQPPNKHGCASLVVACCFVTLYAIWII